MSVEDSRLLARPLFWSVIGERTGLDHEKEKPPDLAIRRLYAMRESVAKTVLQRLDCEQEENAIFRKIGKRKSQISVNTMRVV